MLDVPGRVRSRSEATLYIYIYYSGRETGVAPEPTHSTTISPTHHSKSVVDESGTQLKAAVFCISPIVSGLRRPLQGLLELLLHDLGALEGLQRLALASRLRLHAQRLWTRRLWRRLARATRFSIYLSIYLSIYHPRQWLGSQWPGLALGVPSCEEPGAP